MSPQVLMDNCSAAGVSVHLVGGTLKLRGTAEAVQAVTERVRANKTALLAHLAGDTPIDLVAEFMAVDGLSRADAEAMAAISVQPRTPAYWMGLIAELDLLIDRYCKSTYATEQAKNRIRKSSHSQCLASIPGTIEWFKAELEALETERTSEAKNGR